MLFSAQLIKAQDRVLPLPSGSQGINLEIVLQLGGASNLTIQEYRKKQALAWADLDRAKEWWLPDVYVGTKVHQLWGTTMNADGFFFTDVNRQYFWLGIGLDASWDFGEDILRAKSQDLKAQASVFLTAAERNKVLLEIIEAYYDFLTAQLYYQAYQQLASQGDTIARQIGIQVEAGLRFESELLLALSNQSHLKVEMLKAKMEFGTKSATLVRLLDLSPEVKLVSIDTLLTPLELGTSSDDQGVSDSVYHNHPEYRAANLMLQSRQLERQTTTTGLLLPELRLGMFTSMFGDVFSPLYPTSAINASLLWKIPLGRLTYGGELKQYDAKISLQETQIAQVKSEVNEQVLRARETMKISRQQMEIAQEGGGLAAEALSQSIQRQRLGIVLPFELLQTMEVYIQARLDHLDAVSSYNKAQYWLFVAMGNDL